MRVFVFILVLANILFYAFDQGYLGKSEGPDAGRLARQLNPERIHIVSRGEEPPLPAQGKPGEESAPPATVELAGLTAASAANACLLWKNLAAIDADRLSTLMASRFANFALSRADGGESGGWWIYIPPLANKADAEKKAVELRQYGVTDYFIVQEGPNRFAISLGVFSSEKGGQERYAELKGKGVRSARLMLRPGKDGTISLRAEGPGAGLADLLAALNGDFVKPTQQDCR
ncbi:MAG: SPOR domain-containing protein [Azonexus sp.]|nr:SPOR domain-containing protein [Azonexus sp.]